MGRFKDIERAEELRQAKIKLEAWRGLSREAKKTAYTAAKLGRRTNVVRQVAYVKPFGANSTFWYETKVLGPNVAGDTPTANEETETALVNAVLAAVVKTTGGMVSTTKPSVANAEIRIAKKIQFARVKVSIPGTQERDRVSRFTGNSYKQKESKSVSCVFGAATGAETEPDAKNTIRAAIKASLPNARITFSPQGFVG